jgi:hypothetical protein
MDETVWAGDNRTSEERAAVLKNSISILETRVKADPRNRGAAGLLRFLKKEQSKVAHG